MCDLDVKARGDVVLVWPHQMVVLDGPRNGVVRAGRFPGAQQGVVGAPQPEVVPHHVPRVHAHL